MDFLKSIAIALALITTFSTQGHVTPVEKANISGSTRISSGLYSIDGAPSLEIVTTNETPTELVDIVEIVKPTEVPTELVDIVEIVKPTEANISTEVTEPVEPEVAYFDVPLSEDLQDYIFRVCKSYDIEPEIVIAVIWKESSYRASVMGDNGRAYGLMQVQPRWHKERMKRLGVTDLLDPYQNVLVGIDYLAELYHSKGSMKWALMAYNGGPDYATRKIKAGEISTYASSVLKKAKELGR